MKRRDKLDIRGNARTIRDSAEFLSKLALGPAARSKLDDIVECSEFIIEVVSADIDTPRAEFAAEVTP